MSLNAAQRALTRAELAENLARSGRTGEQVAAELGLGAEQLDAALRLDRSASPLDVWALRDHLTAAVPAAGAALLPWSVLTDDARAMATAWFPLPAAPAVAPSAPSAPSAASALSAPSATSVGGRR
ncbi:DUF2316 family protein [Tersicoccus sp. MR15.9]|uniref:DUF2316 family protein n=1 Tax=Tersicoccus mangrovi TaxID=3121635 RepID=UPI002FE50639